MSTLIAPDNNWALLSILFLSSFLAIYLEQKYKWAAKITGAIITLGIAILLTNLRVIPASAPVFDLPFAKPCNNIAMRLPLQGRTNSGKSNSSD